MSEDQNTVTIETQNTKRKRKIPNKYKDDILLDYKKQYSDLELENIIQPAGEDQMTDYQKRNKSRICSLGSSLKVQEQQSHKAENKKLELCYLKIKNNTVKTNDETVESTKPRNVAVHKTESKIHNHIFDGVCSRTLGVPNDLILRNNMRIVKSNFMTLYPAVENIEISSSNLFYNLQDGCNIIVKEDLELELQEDSKINNESVCVNVKEEEGISLEINHICSLHPNVFENQDNIDFDDICTTQIPQTLSSLETIQTDFSINSDLGNPTQIGKRTHVISATLPIFETECKWWVVELDETKFTNLVYVADGIFRPIGHFLRATFHAAYSNGVFQIPLNKHVGNNREKFGAYAVPGHSHLIFIGPYDLTEGHCLTANKRGEQGYERVLFTSTFSTSKVFESLGINMSQNREHSQAMDDCVKAIWWYSTSKKRVSKLNEKNDKLKEGCNEPIIPSDMGEEERINAPKDQNIHNKIETNKNIESDIDDSSGLKRESLEHPCNSSTIRPYVENDEDLYDESGTENKVCTIDDESHLHPLGRVTRKRRRRKLSLSPKKKCVLALPNQIKDENEEFSMPITTLTTLVKYDETEHLNIDDTCLVDVENSTSDSSDNDFFDDDTVNKKIIKITNKENNIPIHQLPGSNVIDKVINGVKTFIHKPTKNLPLINREREKRGPIPKNLVQDKAFPGPWPDFALLCLWPRVGYIPVVEHSPNKLLMVDPVYQHIEHQFTDIWQASDWLNKYFNRFSIFDNPKMDWVMVKGSFIKFLLPLNPEIFKTFPSEPIKDVDDYPPEPPKETTENKNQAERVRRMEINSLKARMSSIVFTDHLAEKASFSQVLNNANAMIKAQKILSTKFEQDLMEERDRNSSLNAKLRTLIASLDPSTRQQASILCGEVKRKIMPYLYQDISSEEYYESIKQMEMNKAEEIIKDKDIEFTIPNSDDNLSQTSVNDIPPLEPETILQEIKVSEVINLDSDDEDKKPNSRIIEIESDGDDVVLIHDEDSSSENDVEIISSSFQKNRDFPKPKRKMPSLIPNFPQKNSSLYKHIELLNLPGEGEGSSDSVAGPEFVDVTKVCESFVETDDLTDVDKTITGSSRTDPVPLTIQNRVAKFLPINESGRINIFPSSSIDVMAPKNNLKQSHPGKSIILNQRGNESFSKSDLDKRAKSAQQFMPNSTLSSSSNVSFPSTCLLKTSLLLPREHSSPMVIPTTSGAIPNKGQKKLRVLIPKPRPEIVKEPNSPAHNITVKAQHDSVNSWQKNTTESLLSMPTFVGVPTFVDVSHWPGSNAPNIKISNIKSIEPTSGTKSLLVQIKKEELSRASSSFEKMSLSSRSSINPVVSAPVNVESSPSSTATLPKLTPVEPNPVNSTAKIKITNGTTTLKCKNMIPIGKLNSTNEIQGKKVLVTFPLSGKSGGLSLLRRTPVQRENTLTLHHPSGGMSETRTVQFAPVERADNDNIQVPNTSV